MSNEGLLFIISAPSGAGKTSLCKEVTKSFSDLYYSVSYTTRPSRPGEKEGEDYFFVSEVKFQEMVDNKRFGEWAEVHGNRYGTSIDVLEKHRHTGTDVILDIDGQGARQLRTHFTNGISVFVIPPSWSELEKRLRSRKTESDEDIRKRLENARNELKHIEDYDYVLINDDYDQAVSSLKSIIIAERCKRERVLPQICELLQLS